MIISQYNYFHTFHKICEYLHNQYLSDKNEIPLEIQIYNIVNFIPCPVNNKLEISFFPNCELSTINNLKNYDEYKKSKNNNYLRLEQLGGYRHSDINFCKIFEFLPLEFVVQIYIQYFLGRNIALFSEDKEKLHLVIFILSGFLFPLNQKQNCCSLNPNSYFYEELLYCRLSGYLYSYRNIDNCKPDEDDCKYYLFEDYNKSKRSGIEMNGKQFAFVVDIDEKTMEAKKEGENYKEYSIIFEHFKSLDSNSTLSSDTVVDSFIKKLITELKVLSILVNEKKLTSFFVQDEETKIVSYKIKEAFLRFNVTVCEYFLTNYTIYEGGPKVIRKSEKKKQNEEELAKIPLLERCFFLLFERSSFELLYNMNVTYDKGETKMEKASKRGFDNLISLYKENDYKGILITDLHIKLLDCIFLNNNNKEDYLSLSFFEFYKHYYDKLRTYIYRNINDDYIDKKKVKKDKSYNYYYKYKKIIFDR